MKGLFVKDLKLMMLQKNFLLLILAIVIGMMIFTDDVIFPLGFLSFIVSLFTVSTISYDDFDNGNAFLFTLPITRNHYVSEKYFLGLLLGCMAWVLATVLGIITTVLKDTLPITDLVQSSLMILPIMIVPAKAAAFQLGPSVRVRLSIKEHLQAVVLPVHFHTAPVKLPAGKLPLRLFGKLFNENLPSDGSCKKLTL